MLKQVRPQYLRIGVRLSDLDETNGAKKIETALCYTCKVFPDTLRL